MPRQAQSPAKGGLTRRDFMVRSAVTGTGAFLSVALGPSLLELTGAQAAPANFSPAIWFTMTPDGITRMHILKAEMGQHIGTALAQVIAEELEVKWADVRLDYPDGTNENFAKFGLAYTVNSGSVTTEFERLSRAGCAGRTALIEAGAQVLGVGASACHASDSRVIHGASGRSLSYSDILSKIQIDRKFTIEELTALTLKPFGEYKLIGQSVQALDLPDKTSGKAKYGIDVFLPNMVYAALVIPRSRYKSKVLSVDDSAARKIPGFIQAVTIDDSAGKCTGWVLAVAEKFPAAMKAAKALKVDWDPGPYGDMSDDSLMAEYKALQQDPNAGSAWVLEGDVDAALAGSDDVMEAEYTTGMVCHNTMEPFNATAHEVDGTWHVYTGTQSTSFARMTLTGILSAALGVEAGAMNVVIHQSILGGGFGGKQDYDDLIAAALASKAVGRPVKFIQTRESHMATSFARTPTYHKVRAGVKGGELECLDHDLVCGWMGARFGVGRKYGTDWLQQDASDAKAEDMDQWSVGGSDHWYNMKNHRVRGVNHDTTTWAIQASALRTVSNSYNMFVVESFIDEIAHKLGADPVEFRLAMLDGKGGNRGIPNSGYPPGTMSDYYMDRLWLAMPWPEDKSWIPYESATVGGAKRLANCLRVAAGKAGFGIKQLGPNSGMGVAVSAAEERQSPTWVAGVAEVTADPNSGEVTIDHLTIAMDMGIAVNPENIKAQIEGSALWGASQILSERLTFKNGAFQEGNFDTYVPIRLAQVPKIDVEIIQSGHHPTGVGEPASTVVAPAVANAVFNAIGVRVREMPMTREAITGRSV